MFNLTSSDPKEGEKLFSPMEEVFLVDESDKHGERCLLGAPWERLRLWTFFLPHKLKSFAAPYFISSSAFVINERIAFARTFSWLFFRHVQLINFHEHGNIPRSISRLSRITCNSGNAAHAHDVMRFSRVRLLLEFSLFFFWWKEQSALSALMAVKRICPADFMLLWRTRNTEKKTCSCIVFCLSLCSTRRSAN